MNNYHENIALLIMRIFLGILFFIQGYDKVFNIKLPNVIQAFKSELNSSHMPNWIFVLSAYYTSYVELLGGLMLIVGYMKYYALYALGLDIIMVAAAMSMIKPMWDMQFVFPRLVILITLLLVPQLWDVFSLDFLLNK